MANLYQSNTILIREFIPEEQQVFIALFEDEEVARYIPLRSTIQYQELFNDTIADYENGPLGRWGIFDAQTQDFIGMCLTRNFKYISDQVEIGYVLAKKYWGKGIASEVSKVLVAYCFKYTNTSQVVAVTDLENIGSQKVLEKAGLKRLMNLKRDEEELAYFRIERWQHL
ncbi:GNAT family N-acetyltransferase [Pedobacter foliorum]|uniref:GNAT family N-acetyltransferase n=1 Tax=Pedobacter foliorum TaxID=2739058 RepID=UPI0015674F8B|nr:GNAT family N-acetyltransferase [Pedobacter foliorum]NRF37743.1 GNAT family N-acetyltransferase [Pedobacter foliorum]